MLLGYPKHSQLMSGRPSSPLNTNANGYGLGHASSSSPLTSPTPSSSTSGYFQYQPFPSPSPVFRSSTIQNKSAPAARGATTRYIRPKRASLPSSPDLFSEGTTPTEGAMWRERFSRRMEERERRKKKRDDDLDKRRGVSSDGIMADDDQQAQEDDEEIFRRLMILQRRRAQHAALVAHEDETGGSDPNLPEFWEEELDSMAWEERDLLRRLNGNAADRTDVEMPSSPFRGHVPDVMTGIVESDEDRWAREAAEAEEAEREAEEADIARRVEEAYGLAAPTSSMPSHACREMSGMDMDMDMGWDVFDSSMDIE